MITYILKLVLNDHDGHVGDHNGEGDEVHSPHDSNHDILVGDSREEESDKE